MNSKEIARLIRKRTWLRKLGYWIIFFTTLREWYIRKGIKKIIKQLDRSFSLLDAGAGMGQHIYYVAKKNPLARTTGVELDKDQINDMKKFAENQRLDNLKLIQGDLTKVKFSGAFDAVLCCSVLEHIEEDMVVLRKIARHTKENGHLLVYVPVSEKRVFRSLERAIERMVKDAGQRFPHEHVRYYSEEELKNKMIQVGFEPITVTRTYGRCGRLAYDIVTSVQYTPLFRYIFPLYFILVHPFVFLLMVADYKNSNKNGNGLMIIARKKQQNNVAH